MTLQGYEKFNRPQKEFCERSFFFSEQQVLIGLSAHGDIIVIVFGISRHILDDLDERREINSFLLFDALRLQHDKVVDRSMKGVDFEILSLPDEAAACLPDGGTIGIGLLQQ